MAMVVKTIDGEGISYVEGGAPYELVLDILVDTEDEIAALGTKITVGGCCSVIAKPGSIAHTAGFGVMYELSPSGLWVVVAGGAGGGISVDELIAMDLVPCVTDADGAILADENNKIIVM